MAYPRGQVNTLHSSKIGGPCSHLLKVTHHPLVNDLNITQLDLQAAQEHVSDKAAAAFALALALSYVAYSLQRSVRSAKVLACDKASKRPPQIAYDILRGLSLRRR